MFFEIEGPALTTKVIRMLDERAIQEFEIPGILLMENAGLWAAFTALEILEWDLSKKVVVFCGKGNNGGDGFVLARHLHNRGVHVEVCLLGKAEEVRKGSDAEVNLRILRHMNMPFYEVVPPLDWGEFYDQFTDFSLAVDALLGTGLSGKVRSPYEEAISVLNAFPFPRLAIDIPSGLDGDTGKVLGCAVRADYTVTFGAKKVGFYREEGPEYVGEVILVDISWPREIIPKLEGLG